MANKINNHEHAISDLMMALPRHCQKLRQDARLLLAHVLGRSSTFLYTNSDYRLSAQELSSYRQGLANLSQGWPLAYVLGVQSFYGLDFSVSEQILIPRPDTERLVDCVIELGDRFDLEVGLNVLDLGCGSGAISVAIKNQRPNWCVVATDISSQAIAIAKKNASRHDADINFFQGNWYDAIVPAEMKFNIIASNPPYICRSDCHLAKLTHEPVEALVAANNGLADIQLIINGASRYLYSGGWLVIEHGYNQGSAVRSLLTQAGFLSVSTRVDYGDNERVSFGMLTDLDKY